MSLRTPICGAQPRSRTASQSSCSSAGKSTPASSSSATSASEPFRAARPAWLTALASSPSSTSQAAVQPEVVRRALRAADERQHRAVGADEREVGLRVAAVDGEHDLAHAVTSAANGSSRPPAAVALLGDRACPIERVREQRLARVRAVAGQRGLGREPLVGGHVLGEPEQLGRERRLRQRLRHRAVRRGRAPRRRRRRRGRRACRRSARRRRARARRRSRATRRGRSPPRCRTRRRAARAAPASRRARDRGRAAAAPRSISATVAARGTPSALLRQHCVVGVEVAEVRRRHGAELLEQPQRQRRLRRERLAVLGEQAGQHVRRRRPARARIQVRWLRPTWSTSTRSGSTPSSRAIDRWNLIATLHRPTARWPASSSARVTIPTGFVKSTIQAPGAASCAHALGDLEHHRHGAQRLRRARRRRSSPGRCSRTRAGWSRPRGAPAARRPGSGSGRSRRRRPRGRARRSPRATRSKPWRSSMRAASPPTTSRRSASMSCRTSSRTSIRSRSRESPETSSGV